MLLPREAYPLQKINKPLFPGRIVRLTLMLYAVVPITVWVSVERQTVLPRHLLCGNALRCHSRLYRVVQSTVVILLTQLWKNS